MFLSGSLHLSLSATQANDPLVSQNINSIESNILNVTQPTEAEFTQKATAALKKFFYQRFKVAHSLSLRLGSYDALL